MPCRIVEGVEVEEAGVGKVDPPGEVEEEGDGDEWMMTWDLMKIMNQVMSADR